MKAQSNRHSRAFLVTAAALAILANNAIAATSVPPASGHPQGEKPWSAANLDRTRLIDNGVCKAPGFPENFGWVTPLFVTTSTGNRTTTITQVRTGAGSSEAWSFNANGTAFQGIGESSSTRIGNLVVPPGGTAFVKTNLGGNAISANIGCLTVLTFS